MLKQIAGEDNKMPCVITKEEEEFYEKDSNRRIFGEFDLSSRITTRVACEFAKILEKNGLLNQVSSVGLKWIEQHKKEDEKREKG